MEWRKRNIVMDPEHQTPTVKHDAGNVMTWGYMCSSGVGNLFFFIENMIDKFKRIKRKH